MQTASGAKPPAPEAAPAGSADIEWEDPTNFDYAGALLGTKPKQGGVTNGLQQRQGEEGQKGSEVDYAAMLYGTIQGPQPGQKTLRDQPGKPTGKQGLSFNALQKAAWVDDPGTKAKIFAAEQFPGEDPAKAAKRYFQRGGDWYYLDDDGMAYPVRGEGPAPEGNKGMGWATNLAEGAKSVGAEMIGKSPVNIGAGAGLAVGTLVGHPHVGMLAGTALGHMARKTLAHNLLDEPVETPGQFLTGMGQEMLGAEAGYWTGKAIPKLANKTANLGKDTVVAPAIKGELDTINPAAVLRRLQQYRQAGITPTLAELFDSPTLEAYVASASKTPGGASEVMRKWAEGTRIPELQQAIETAITNIAPAESVISAGGRGISAAQNVKAGLEGTREGLAKPYYEAAEQSQTAFDVSDIVANIDKHLDPRILPPESEIAGKLRGLRSLMVRTEVGQDGKPVEIMDLTIPAADTIKKEIDKYLKIEGKNAVTKRIRGLFTDIKSQLTSKADEAVPDYNVARGVFAEASLPVNEFETGTMTPAVTKKYSKTFLERMTETTGLTETERLPEKLFTLSPKEITHARKFIESEYPDEWSSLVAGALRSRYEKLKPTVEGTDLGYRWMKSFAVTPQDYDRLRAMLTQDQFDNLRNLFDVLKQTERIVYNKSLTAMMQEVPKQAKIQAGGPVANAMARWGTISPQKIGQTIQQLRYPDYMERVIKAVVAGDQQTITDLTTLKKLPPGAVRAIGFASLVAGITGEGLAENEFASYDATDGMATRQEANKALRGHSIWGTKMRNTATPIVQS